MNEIILLVFILALFALIGAFAGKSDIGVWIIGSILGLSFIYLLIVELNLNGEVTTWMIPWWDKSKEYIVESVYTRDNAPCAFVRSVDGKATYQIRLYHQITPGERCHLREVAE